MELRKIMKDQTGLARNITILGGGIAGLAVGYYAKKNNVPFTIIEAKDCIGGNCVTFRYSDFLFDSGAHRLHDKDADATRELKGLLKENFHEIQVPSRIYHNGKTIDFPLSPLNLIKSLGLWTSAKALVDVVHSRLTIPKAHGNFERYALHTYGKTIAECLLLNYSEKLWGESCHKLSTSIAGKRIKGLTMKTFLFEALFGQRLKTRHLDGSFYYPASGIGMIVKELGRYCTEKNIWMNSIVTRVMHNNKRIVAVEVNNKKIVPVEEMVSTLPLPLFLEIMEPRPPAHLLSLAGNLRFRHLILVVFFLNRKSVTESASIYFPDPSFPFTRISEPKNRSSLMSPPDKTSLILEIPCHQTDALWTLNDDKLIQINLSKLVKIGWIGEKEVIQALVHRISYAYPLLEIDSEDRIRKIHGFLNRFENLRLSGRCAQFGYTFIHDSMKSGREIIDEYLL